MLGVRTVARRGRDEAEKPFWISYADLMTSLMVLFLVVMLVALLSFARQSAEAEQRTADLRQAKITSEQRAAELERANADLERQKQLSDEREATLQLQTRELERQKTALAAQKTLSDRLAAENGTLAGQYRKIRARQDDFEDAKKRVRDQIRRRLPAGAHLTGDRIDFGTFAQFDQSRSDLTAQRQRLIRSVVPGLIATADGTGRGVLRRVVVEGFASLEGSYLLNLNLSLARSQRVMCAILDESPDVGAALVAPQRNRARQLFLIGGYSSNSLRSTPEASRRIELRIEWWDPAVPLAERRHAGRAVAVPNGRCALGG